MKIGEFRRNVSKVVFAKQIKETLRYTSRKTERAKVVKLCLDLGTGTGQLLESQEGYILGSKMTTDFKEVAGYNLGEVGASLVALSKILKIKTPTATKKKKLVGTRAAGLLKLHGLAADLMLNTGLIVC